MLSRKIDTFDAQIEEEYLTLMMRGGEEKNGKWKMEEGKWRSEIRGRRSEVRGQKSEVGGQRCSLAR
jgi:hypothetical protein